MKYSIIRCRFSIKKSIAAILFFVTLLPSRADEGMWLPLLVERLNYVDMKEKGLKLTAEEIYSVNRSCIKDAIVGLSKTDDPTEFFCTAEVISKNGLLLTNHHCGFEAVQSHSSVESDYLSNGFWAMNKNEELVNEGMCAVFLVRMEDVTQMINGSLQNITNPLLKSRKKEEIIEKLKKENSENDKYIVSVKSFFKGNEYYMFVYEVFRDVRLVGAPPSSIGKFGGDIDNWMWPRHTGDFSLLRVYTDADGKPADYSKDNLPLSPKYVLPISLKGVHNDDYAMIMGYPGSTDRYLTSYGVNDELETTGPSTVKIRTLKLDIIKKDMDNEPAVKIKYASKYASTSNYWKYFIGQTQQLKRNKVPEKKQALEKAFTDWVNQDENRMKEYGNALVKIKEAQESLNKYSKVNTYLEEAVFQGPEAIYQVLSSGFYQIFNSWDNLMKSKELMNLIMNALKEQCKTYFKDYSKNTDKKLFIGLLQMYYNDISAEFHLSEFKILEKKFKKNFSKWADFVYENSIFCDEQKFNTFMEKPDKKVLEKDQFLVILNSVLELYSTLETNTAEAENKLNEGYRIYIKGLREMLQNKKFYPDANSTMRLTYGIVKDYFPSDAVQYEYFTTLEGIMEKENPNDEDFIVSPKLKEIFTNKDYGRYGENGKMKVCFLTTNDITGGNSGSPVINGNGELIGCAFDGNWEAMSGDIWYEPQLQRTICVDIRYVLLIIDKYAGATHLINEMNING